MAKGSPKGTIPPHAGLGRPKGVPNRITTEFRTTVQKLLDDNRENVGRWLEDVAEGNPDKDLKPDPGRALDLLAKLADYAAPKLARTVIVGDPNEPMHHTFSWQSDKS